MSKRKLNLKKSNAEFDLYLSKNKKNRKTLIYILCGYKDFLWDRVFYRLKKYLDIDADICLLSSGIFKKELYDLAKKNNWCYLSTKVNNVCVAQNITILAFNKAENIIKIDEDVFVTRGVFSGLLNTQKQLEQNKIKYCYITPILNVNGHTSSIYLDLLNKKELTIKKFGKFQYFDDLVEFVTKSSVYNNPNLVKYLWNSTNELLDIDKANSYLFKLNRGNYVACCEEYITIGMILFTRRIWWNKLKLFDVTDPSSNDMSVDETCFHILAKRKHYKKIVYIKSVCGHFSFKPTTSEMKNYFLTHKNKF